MFAFNLSTLVVVVAGLVALGLWHESGRAREAANRIALDACRRRSFQFLDGTVALAALRPRFAHNGLRLERTYVFDYSVEGAGRASGFVIMLGHEVQHVGFDRG